MRTTVGGEACRIAAIVLLSKCDCTQTRFGDKYISINSASNPTVNPVNTARGDPVQYVTLLLADSVSYSCGNGDGFTFCGARTFIIQPINDAPMSIITHTTAAATQTVTISV